MLQGRVKSQVKFQMVALLVLLLARTHLHAEDIALPAQLPAYESYLEKELAHPSRPANNKGNISVIVGLGDEGVVRKQYRLLLPAGSTLADAASFCRKNNETSLIGWAQGLVVVRRKTGDTITRIVWPQTQARQQASCFVLQNGDALIGLSQGDF